MSLDVSPKLLAEAEHGDIREADFVDTVRTSLPYAYNLIAGLATELTHSTSDFTDNQTPPPSEQERGQLLRALASDAIQPGTPRRRALGGETYARFTSARAQVLNQSPEFRDY
ncbi:MULTISPECIES: SCO5389 family protein [unclassified Streptomyces]|uniref:SCO5389 family protein n=1 Tax=unclassified Streptomyces TaxID=2593676 RepID=UPI00403CECB4